MRNMATFLGCLLFAGCASPTSDDDGFTPIASNDLSMKPKAMSDLAMAAPDLAQSDAAPTGDDGGDGGPSSDDGAVDMAATPQDMTGMVTMDMTGMAAMDMTGMAAMDMTGMVTADMATTPSDMAMTVTDMATTPSDMAMTIPDMAGAAPVDMAMTPSDMAGTAPVDMAGKPTDMAGANPDLAKASDMAQATDGGVTCHPVVNEVQTGGVNGSDEFIEVLNPCQTAVDVTNWTLDYRSSGNTNPVGGADTRSGIVTFMGMLMPHAYVVACGQSFTGTCDTNYGIGVMSGTAGAVGLRDGNRKLIDSVAYGTVSPMNAFIETAATVAPAASHSIERLPDGVDTDNNSKDFKETATPTPKKPNM